jgi:hypothetical protein
LLGAITKRICIIEELVAGLLRVITFFARIVLEAGVVDLSIRKPGKVILTILRPKYWDSKMEPSEKACAIVGFVFWACICLVIFKYAI